MAFFSLTSVILLGTQLFSLAAAIESRETSPELPKADKTTPHCTWWYDNKNARPYQDILDENRITMDKFRQWNPTIGASGEGLVVGRAYCVEAAFEPGSQLDSQQAVNRPPTPPAKPISNDPKLPSPAKPVKNNPAPPSPTQAGLDSTCTAFFRVEAGETCWGITQKHGTFTLDDFYKWNPAIGSECRRLFAGFYVCVGVPETQPSQPPSINKGPSPTQAGIVKTCNSYHQAVSGQGCWDIAIKFGIELDDFYKWNTAIVQPCSGLWAGYHYCVGVSPAS